MIDVRKSLYLVSLIALLCAGCDVASAQSVDEPKASGKLGSTGKPEASGKPKASDNLKAFDELKAEGARRSTYRKQEVARVVEVAPEPDLKTFRA
ncbi:MAG: hypothetical protein ACJA0V_004292, partial [Planctomycetota bacterium]